MNSILKIFDPTSKTWKGVSAIKGDTGKSAYQLAVEAGYAGTEAQFKVEQASIANNSARLTTVEKSKANLVDGFIAPEEIHPLQGKQTGVEIDKANRLSSKVPVSFSNIIGSNNFSIEFYYDSNKLTMPSGAIYGLCSVSDIVSIYRQSTGGISFQLINRRTDGTRYSLNLTNQAPYNGRLHIVLSANRTTNEFTAYINNVKFDQKIFTENISHNINAVIAIGDAQIGAAKTDIIQFRVFNKELLKDDVTSLWNGGHPEEYRLIDKSSLFAEYIPEYLSLTGWKDSSGNGNDLATIGNVTLSYGRKYSGSPMTPLFVACGAVYNTATGFYELNGLADITEEQMAVIYNQTNNRLDNFDLTEAMLYSKARTNIVYKQSRGSYMGILPSSQATFASCSLMEVVKLAPDNSLFSTANAINMFRSSLKLRRIIGALRVGVNDNMFLDCSSLEDVKLHGLNKSISLADCSKLTRDSIIYLITNAANTTPITVTLHADTKTRLTEADIALASSKNITIA